MGRGLCDYPGYGETWLSGKDLTKKDLLKYGIVTTSSIIKENKKSCIQDYVITGGRGYIKHAARYNIKLLKEFLHIGGLNNK
jgi:hypothetical protein